MSTRRDFLKTAAGTALVGGNASAVSNTPGHSVIGARTEPPGVKFWCFAFNGQAPGPLFRVQENDWVKADVRNHTEAMHTMHRHGVDLIFTMDGVPIVNQDPVHPGGMFVYRFQARSVGTGFCLKKLKGTNQL